MNKIKIVLEKKNRFYLLQYNYEIRSISRHHG